MLAELLKLIQGNPQLLKDPMEQGRPNFLAAVDGNRYTSPVGMVPPRVASSLPGEYES